MADRARIEREFRESEIVSTQFQKKPSDEHMLQMYGLYKQSTTKTKFDNVKKPGMTEFKEKAKRRAWEPHKDKDKYETMQAYTKLINGFKGLYEWDPNKAPETVGGK